MASNTLMSEAQVKVTKTTLGRLSFLVDLIFCFGPEFFFGKTPKKKVSDSSDWVGPIFRKIQSMKKTHCDHLPRLPLKSTPSASTGDIIWDRESYDSLSF